MIENQKFDDGKLTIIFDIDEDEAFYMLKDRETGFPIEVVVKDGKEVVARYRKKFKETKNSNSYNMFVRKFLTDVEYRKDFLFEGDWNGIVQIETPSGINIKCYDAIQNINTRSAKRLNFKDFAGLKTFGIDSFSRMKKEKLIEVLSEDDVRKVESEFDDEKIQLNCLRWLGRGLKIDLAIRKVRTDLEIQKNLGVRK